MEAPTFKTANARTKRASSLSTLRPGMRPWSAPFALACALLLLVAAPAWAHPAPFSYLDITLAPSGVSGTLVLHDFDAAAELADVLPEALTDPQVAAESRDELVRLLGPRIWMTFDGQPVDIEWGAIEALAETQSLRLAFKVKANRPAHLSVHALVFPYDLKHQTFVNIYEDGALRHQAILDISLQDAAYYSGSAQGRLYVVRTFVLSGIQHILIGPDHILFLVGLLLLRGTLRRLALIVTAFTLGHSVTLTLAALDLVSPPARIIEPLIALTIVVVGIDNLLVLRDHRAGASSPRDIRALLAAGFGLIHGFGFAYVLREFGLPASALGFSLFAFNLGVEIGQLAIVLVVASGLAILALKRPGAARRVALAGSICVSLAGAFWFVQRTFFPGG